VLRRRPRHRHADRADLSRFRSLDEGRRRTLRAAGPSSFQAVAPGANSFDWVRWKNRLYVLDGSAFHAEFRDSNAIKAAVVDHVATIQKKITIQGADRLIERCQASVAMASKLQRVAEIGIYDRPVKELKAYAKTHKIVVEWDKDALVFDGSIDAQWGILKLLDEDRTDGPVSGRVYESSSKRTI
jgi:hypothetical protein